jgi:hypothetical protein
MPATTITAIKADFIAIVRRFLPAHHMFKKFFERAAAKASMVNMKFDLDRLASSFPHNIPGASNALFELLENITFAFSNDASDAEVQQVIAAKSANYPSALREILDQFFRLILAARRGDPATVIKHDSRINDLFQSATGGSLNVTKMPWFSKLAMKPSLLSDMPSLEAVATVTAAASLNADEEEVKKPSHEWATKIYDMIKERFGIDGQKVVYDTIGAGGWNAEHFAAAFEKAGMPKDIAELGGRVIEDNWEWAMSERSAEWEKSAEEFTKNHQDFVEKLKNIPPIQVTEAATPGILPTTAAALATKEAAPSGRAQKEWPHLEPAQQKYVEAAVQVATNLYLDTTRGTEDKPTPLQFSLPDSRFRYMIFCLVASVTAALLYDDKMRIQREVFLTGCLHFAEWVATENPGGYIEDSANAQDATAYFGEFLKQWSQWVALMTEGNAENIEIVEQLVSSMIHTTESNLPAEEADMQRLRGLALSIGSRFSAMREAFVELANQ